ncbi:hypothetical protein KUV50_00985 [Membranicola marinus]|uniref:Cell surface protein n=1 Tax=Membranihabitans marinus TaxID=1227546 RepID=A0A953HKF8_9BACT|nr:DUF5074 domain-containing protein [Membranihabitans marinus]MBY5956689.1 hypothetical protein [Membranihabitans marinus]
MKNLFLFIAFFTGFIFLSSCEKEEPEQPDQIDSFEDGVIISCEGAFGQGNAVVYFLDPAKQAYVPEIYRTVNQEPAGDVLQSITFENDNAYLVMNNSGQIIQATEKTFEKTGSIEGLSAPTEIDIEDGQGYIGSLYSQHILVADMNSLQVNDSIFLGEQSNRIFEDDNRLWILSQSDYQGRVKDHIYVINLTDHSVDSVKVGSHPTDWAIGDNDELYVYCRGNETGESPSIHAINTESPSTTQQVELAAPGGFFTKIAYDERENRVLIPLEDGIYAYQPGDNSISSTALINLDQITALYGLGVSPDDGDIYVGDAKDFNSAGVVAIYTSTGEAKGALQVGIGPNNFYFD